MERSSRVSERGYTLIESSVAALVLSIGILAVGSLSFNTVNLMSRTGNSTMAINLASSTLEGLEVGLPPDGDVTESEQLPFASIVGTSPPFYFKRSGESVSDETTARFLVLWVATPDEGGFYTDVAVTVYWTRQGPAPTDPTSANHQITLTGRLMIR